MLCQKLTKEAGTFAEKLRNNKTKATMAKVGIILYIISILFAMNSDSVLKGFLGGILPMALIVICLFYNQRKREEDW